MVALAHTVVTGDSLASPYPNCFFFLFSSLFNVKKKLRKKTKGKEREVKEERERENGV